MNKITTLPVRSLISSARSPLSLLVATTICTLGIYSDSFNTAYAQSRNTLSTEGIVGDVDKGRRAPVLTFSTEIAADGSSATILADTQVINEDYRKYPISLDFYVNGKLFSKQFRSVELPAPLGIVVPKELAAVPFNYSIVATLIHPNRQYVTVAQGAVSLDDSSSALQCTVTLPISENTVGTTIAGTAPNTLNADNALIFTLTQDDQSAEVSLTIPASDSSTTREASGSIVVKQADASEATYQLAGTATASGSIVSTIETTSTEGDVTLNCEPAPTVTEPTGTVDDSSDIEEDANDANISALLEGSNIESNTADGVGPRGEPNFVPLDKVDGVEVVN